MYILQVAAKLVDRPEKAQWKKALGTEEEETVLTDKFKEIFEQYSSDNAGTTA
jgi:hypothetical protein